MLSDCLSVRFLSLETNAFHITMQADIPSGDLTLKPAAKISFRPKSTSTTTSCRMPSQDTRPLREGDSPAMGSYQAPRTSPKISASEKGARARVMTSSMVRGF